MVESDASTGVAQTPGAVGDGATTADAAGDAATTQDTSGLRKAADAKQPPPMRTNASLASIGSAATGHSDSGSKPSWQWEHRTGFRLYSEMDCDRIERFYQAGYWMMRTKSGEGSHAKPREIYFADMIQFDPHSGNIRKVRRIPGATRWQKMVIFGNSMLRSFLIGEDKWWKAKTKADYDQIRYLAKGEVPDNSRRLRKDSWWYLVSDSWTFATVSLLVIITNSIYIWVDADFNPGVTIEDTPLIFIIADNIFTLWFTFEALARCMTYKKWRYILTDSWLLLDIVLVTMMILETWLLQLMLWVISGESGSVNMNQFSILRGVRLLRLVRIARLFKAFPQLFVLVKGMALAMKSLFYTLELLFVLLFVFGVALKNFADINPSLNDLGFGTVRSAMWRLLLDGIFMDSVGDLLNGLLEIGFPYVGMVLLFIFMSNLTMLNMLIGVLCDVITRVTEEQSSATALDMLERGLQELLETYDTGDDRELQREEFCHLMSNPDFRMILSSHNIDPADLMRLEDVLYEERVSIGFDSFLEKVFQLRGGNTATVNDVAELRSFLNKRFNSIASLLPGYTPSEGKTTRSESKGSKPAEDSDNAQPQADLPAPAAAKPEKQREASGDKSASNDLHDPILGAIEKLQAGQLGDIERMRAGHAGLKTQVVDLRASVDKILELLSAANSIETPAA